MNVAHFRQLNSINVSSSAHNKLLLSLKLPPGSYVIIAKFNVAVEFGADTDRRPRISKFGLSFGGMVDTSWCDLKQGELDAVVLTVAGSHELRAVMLGQSASRGTAKLYCIQSSDDLEAKLIALSAIPVDAVATGEK
jgi:hypothetical protein